MPHKNTKKITKHLLSYTLGLFVFFIILSTIVTAAPDQEITYHGKLTNTANIAVPDGNYTFTLSIHDQPTGGGMLWTDTQVIPVQNGIFSTTLTNLGAVTFEENYYLQVQIDSNSPMTPRRKITPTGFALNSHRLNGQEEDYYLNTSNDNQTKQGDLTIDGNLTLNNYTLTNNDGNTNQVLKTDGSGNVSWSDDNDTTTFTALTDTPASYSANQLVRVNSAGNALEYYSDAPYYDNTDTQTLSFTSPNLSITGGNSVDLSSLNNNETLHAVTTRGNTTTNSVTTGNLTVSNDEALVRINSGDDLARMSFSTDLTDVNDDIARMSFSADGTEYSRIATQIYGSTDNGVLDLSVRNDGVNVDQTIAMRIAGSENGPYIGMGETAPSQRLHINGNMRLTGAFYDVNNQLGTSGQILSTTGSGTDWIDASTIGSTTFLGLTDTMNSFTSGSILFTSPTAVTENNSNFFWDNANNRLGINTNTPQTALDVNGGVKFGNESSACIPALAGTTRYNSTSQVLELCDGSAWQAIGSGSGSGSVGETVPAGTVVAFTTNTCPTNYVAAEGQTISRTGYPDLYTTLGDTYGNGDGSTTFNIPDYRGQFLRGWDNSAGVDPDAGSRTDRGDGTTGDNVGTRQNDRFESHSHNFRLNQPQNDALTGSITGYYERHVFNYVPMQTTYNTGGNETRPVNTNVLYCIKSTNSAGGNYLASLWDTDVNTGIQTEKTANDDIIRFDIAGVEMMQLTSTGLTINSNTVWHAGNDGTGSTLDADLLDGNDSSYFMTATTDNWVDTTGDTMTGTLNAQDILPTTDDTYDLGSSTHRWQDLYLGSNTLHIGTSTTDEGLISYDTVSNILNFGTDSTTNGDIAFNTNQLFIDTSTGNVGIGTNSPHSNLTLDVNGTLRATNTFYAHGGISFEGGVASPPTNFLIDYDNVNNIANLETTSNSGTSSEMAFSTSGLTDTGSVERMRIDADGNVGIGTTSPSEKLHLRNGILLVDHPSTPTITNTYDTSGWAYGVDISDDKYAYVADYETGLQIIDVSDSNNPSLVGSYNTPGYAADVKIGGKYAYIADAHWGLRIVDISNPSNPTSVGLYNTSGSAYAVAINGKYAYIADGVSGLQIIDVSNPTNPTLVGTYDYDANGVARDVVINKKYAYIADQASGVHIIDISNPASPTLAGHFSTTSAGGIDVNGKYAYVADNTSGLRIYDISDPSSPSHVDTHDFGNFATKITVSGKYAYAVDVYRLYIIDISNPSAASTVGYTNNFGRAEDVVVSGKYAYVGGFDEGLHIIDIKGANIHAAHIGNLQTEEITVTKSMDINNHLSIGDGLNVGKSALINGGLSVARSVRFSTFGAGTLQTDANGNLSVSSDERLKNINGIFTRGLNDLLNINPISFNWKQKTGYDTKNSYYGFSAQNIQQNIPEAVGQDNHGYLTLSDRPILATAINAIKEQNINITSNTLQTDKNINTLQQLQTSVDENLANIQLGLTDLYEHGSVLSGQVDANILVIKTVSDIEDRLEILEAGLDIMTHIDERILTIDPDALMFINNDTLQRAVVDEDGNEALQAITKLTLDGIMTVQTLKAENIETNTLAINDNITEEDVDGEEVNAASVGTVTISDDMIDVSENVNEKMEITVQTTAIKNDSRVFVTVRDAPELVVAQVKSIVDGMFTIEFDYLFDEEPWFIDWFIVGSDVK